MDYCFPLAIGFFWAMALFVSFWFLFAEFACVAGYILWMRYGR